MEVWLIYNVVLLLGVQHSDSVNMYKNMYIACVCVCVCVHTYSYSHLFHDGLSQDSDVVIFFPLTDYYKMLSITPCAIR